MKNIFLLLLLFTGIVEAQIVNIPDANFKAKLLSSNSMSNQIAMDDSENYIMIDANSDGEIQLSEAEAVHLLNVSNANISDLTGIGSFSNLRQLGCNSNQLSQLDISSLINLNGLVCNNNLLSQLDLSNQLDLTYLNCSNNSLTQLDVSDFINLYFLDCSNNILSNLNIENLPNLEEFDCHDNQLTSLNFTAAAFLIHCYLNDNALTDLVFGNLTFITIFDISNNQIQDLDLSKVRYRDIGGEFEMPASALYTGNPLRTLNMKNGYFDGMAFYNAMNDINTWEFICSDENEAYLVSLNLPSITNLVVNSYCSFIPGGNYNTISGNVKYDSNSNGCDASDINYPNIRININDGTNQGAAFTNNSGNYAFYTLAGNFGITPSMENPSWFNITPPTIAIPFVDNNNNTIIQDFCIAPNGMHPDVEIVITPIIPAKPGFNAWYYIAYKNKGNQVLSGNIAFTYNDAILDFISASTPPDLQNTGILNWNYFNLFPFENRGFYVTLYVNASTDTPPVTIGDLLDFESSITPLVTDETPEDNVFAFQQTVVDSYNVNDIACLEGDVVAPSEIGNYLHYAINFENIGTAAAENIVVKTVIDPAEFDVNSLQLINSSFPVDARITGDNVEFIFNNINLDIGGHGHILLKIKTNNTLVAGDTVSRSADVFFDYNAPVDTGLVTTVFQTLSNSVFELDSSVAIYPNPAVNEVTISADNKIKSIQLYDAQGRIILTRLMDDLESKIDISSHSKGIYFIKITTEKGAQVQKLLKD